jgi:hypothetical protein
VVDGVILFGTISPNEELFTPEFQRPNRMYLATLVRNVFKPRCFEIAIDAAPHLLVNILNFFLRVHGGWFINWIRFRRTYGEAVWEKHRPTRPTVRSAKRLRTICGASVVQIGYAQ